MWSLNVRQMKRSHTVQYTRTVRYEKFIFTLYFLISTISWNPCKVRDSCFLKYIASLIYIAYFICLIFMWVIQGSLNNSTMILSVKFKLYFFRLKLKLIKSVAYSSQWSHTGQLDFCNWLADGSTTG